MEMGLFFNPFMYDIEMIGVSFAFKKFQFRECLKIAFMNFLGVITS